MTSNISPLFIIVLTIWFNFCVAVFIGYGQKISDSANTSTQQMYNNTICDEQVQNSAKNNFKQKQLMSTHSDSVNSGLMQQYRKLLIEKKYEDALRITGIAISEKAKMLAKEHPEISPELIRLQLLSCAYLDINLLLGHDEEALKKYEETISQLSKEQYDNIRHAICFNRLILFSRLNRMDDFINECNNLINRPLPTQMDYLFGYIYGTFGYAIKKDYKKAEQYLSSAKLYFTVVSPNYNDNDVTIMRFRQHLELCEIFLTRLKNEYDLKPTKIQPTITETSDGSLEIKRAWLIDVVSKKTGNVLKNEDVDEMIKKWQEEKEQEQKNKLQDDSFLRELRTNSQETNSQNTLEK
jgi:hypothetical protein